MKVRLKITTLLFAALTACGVNENAYTLYKITEGNSGERVVVKSFDSEATSELNGRACFKEKVALSALGDGAQYWCAKEG